ncbi:MAG: twin-arginine translocation signal domain-containing protein, partial [Caldilineaceae bacterium]|nr:twin-arginine translocation signal domain-containing protein [Caldilineaceae bacterium]
MFGTLSRRDFLKGAAAFVAALSVSSWFPLPRRAAGQSSPLPVAPGFTPLPSQLATGAQIADIAAAWDGSHWAVDTLGIPHVFDPLQQQWTPFGAGVDAATVVGDAFYLFRRDEVAIYNQTTNQSTAQPIGLLWPGLPPSFTSDLDGAFATGNLLYLCRGGRYVSADLSSAPVTFSQPAPLNTWPGWPANDLWGQGTVAKTATWIDDRIGVAALFIPVQTPPAEYAYSYLVQGGSTVTQPIAQLNDFIPPLLAPQLADLLTSNSFDAYVAHTTTDNVTYSAWVFAGPIIWSQSSSDQGSGPAVAAALATWV